MKEGTGTGGVGYIGHVYYFVEPVENSKILYFENIAQQDQSLVVVSDCGDCLFLDSRFNSLEN